MISCIGKQEIGLKWLAVLMMTIDHMAVVFVSTDSWLYLFARNLGRIAAPLFAYLLVAGFLVSRDQKSYRHRLLMYALLSQLPFALLTVAASPQASENFGLLILLSWNVMMVLWASTWALQLWRFVEKRSQWEKMAFCVLCFTGWLILSIFADSGGYIPVWVLVFYVFREQPRMAVLGYLGTIASFVAISFFIDDVMFPPNIKLWMLPGYLSVAVILYCLPALTALYQHTTPPPCWQRNLFYVWYPLHMLLISMLA